MQDRVETVYLRVQYDVHEEDGQFVSVCPQLGTASCGATRDEALRNLKDAVELHLTVLDEEGELVRLLSERGVVVASIQGSIHQESFESIPENGIFGTTHNNILWSGTEPLGSSDQNTIEHLVPV